jgi:HK97 family phage major capsid protein
MNIKKLNEDKNTKISEMENLLNGVKAEERAFTEDEQKQFDELKSQIEAINKTIEAFETSRELVDDAEKEEKKQKEEEEMSEEERALELEQRDVENFAKYIRNEVLTENRDTTGNSFTKGANGVIVPTTIANKIIKTAYNMSPILEKATKYNTKGNLEIPVYGKTEDDEDITVAYGEDFTELVEKAGAFSSVTLKDYLIGALAKIGNSLVNNTDIDLVNIVINIIAEYVKLFLEGEVLKGTTGKITGCSDIPASQTVTTAVIDVISYDDLVKVKNKVIQSFRKGSIWVVSQDTQTVLETMKDGNERPMFLPDPTGEFDGMVLGYPVYVSDNMENIAGGKTAIVFGNFSGIALKTAKDLEIQVLREKYATQHATGVVAWLECDAKVEHLQKLSKLVIKAN